MVVIFIFLLYQCDRINQLHSVIYITVHTKRMELTLYLVGLFSWIEFTILVIDGFQSAFFTQSGVLSIKRAEFLFYIFWQSIEGLLVVHYLICWIILLIFLSLWVLFKVSNSSSVISGQMKQSLNLIFHVLIQNSFSI
jgi:hypothetical protein